MVSFSEQFPSLDFRTGFNPFCPSEKLLLQENCLDKQRVNDAIEYAEGIAIDVDDFILEFKYRLEED